MTTTTIKRYDIYTTGADVRREHVEGAWVAFTDYADDRAALVEQIKEAQRQRDEADATNADTLAALGAAEADAAIWKRRAERAEAAISSAVRELREQLQPNSTAARGDDSSTGEGRDSAPADGTR